MSTNEVWIIFIITCGVCYCFYKVCEIILTHIKVKHGYPVDSIDTDSSLINVNLTKKDDVEYDNKDNR